MTMRSRRLRSLAAIAALVSMLVAQVSMALAACDVAPVSQSMQGHEAHATPCHEPQHSDNLCAAHCRNNDQSLDKPQVKVPAAAAAIASTPAARIPHLASAVPASSAPLAAGPPRRILFQSFLI